MKKILKILGITILLVSAGQVFSQEKYEKESRLRDSEIPAKALDFIESVNTPHKWKWYLEESLTGKTIEAKSIVRAEKYSIEFDTSGQLLDIEVEKKEEQIAESVLTGITTYLEKTFATHSIQKIQKQYTGSAYILLQIASGNDSQPGVVIQWELVVKGKNQGRPKLFEITFDNRGNQVKTKQIIFKNTDNLEY